MDKKQMFNEFIVEQLENSKNFANIYVNNIQDAEDVVSESIVKAMRKINTLREPNMMKTWFFRIIINTSINHLKKKSKSFFSNIQTPVYYFNDFSRLEFDDLLYMLPEQDKRILSLRFYDNCEFKEIANLLNINENTVKTRLYRAINKLKLEITSIQDSESLAVKAIAGKNRINNLLIIILPTFLSAVCFFNLFPSISSAAYDIPFIGDIIKVITFYRFEYENEDNNFEAEIILPEIQGLLDTELQNKLNAEFVEFADDLVRSFEESIIELNELEQEIYENAHMSIKADYEVKTDNDRILAINAYLYSDVNSYTIHKFCTIDKLNGTLVELNTLFKQNADYITPVSDYILNEMIRINKEEDGLFSVGDDMFEGFKEIRPDHNFYINEDYKIVICFDKYEVTAGFKGSPEFIIPTEIITDILISDLIS